MTDIDDDVIRTSIRRMYIGDSYMFFRHDDVGVLEHLRNKLGGQVVLRRNQPNNARRLFMDWAVDYINDGPNALKSAAEKLLPYAELYAPGWRVSKLSHMIKEIQL